MRANRLPLDHLGGLGIFNVMARALTLLPQEQDRFERIDGVVSAVGAPRRGLFDRLSNWVWSSEQRATEAYLAKATDIFDLEARIRQLERRSPCRYY